MNGGWQTESSACRLMITFAGVNARTAALPAAASRLRKSASATTKISATLMVPPSSAEGVRTAASVSGRTFSAPAIRYMPKGR